MEIYQRIFDGILGFHIDFHFDCKTNKFDFVLNSPSVWEKHFDYYSAYNSYLQINFTEKGDIISCNN